MCRDHQSYALDHNVKSGPACSQPPLPQERLAVAPVPPPEVRLIPIAAIRSDGGAQHRIASNPDIVNEYAELMQAGVEFSPICVRQDGKEYWPSDGFQRLAAAKLVESSEIRAEIRPGTKEDAQWDSYAANATHGMRRTAAETEKVIQLALQHSKAAKITNVQIANHLHIPESTVRYWRKRLSSQRCEDSGVRTVTRGGTTYDLHVTGVSKKNRAHVAKPRRDFQAEITEMRENASDATKDFLNILEKWARNQLSPARCLELIENIIERNRGVRAAAQRSGGEAWQEHPEASGRFDSVP